MQEPAFMSNNTVLEGFLPSSQTARSSHLWKLFSCYLNKSMPIKQNPFIQQEAIVYLQQQLKFLSSRNITAGSQHLETARGNSVVFRLPLFLCNCQSAMRRAVTRPKCPIEKDSKASFVVSGYTPPTGNNPWKSLTQSCILSSQHTDFSILVTRNRSSTCSSYWI